MSRAFIHESLKDLKVRYAMLKSSNPSETQGPCTCMSKVVSWRFEGAVSSWLRERATVCSHGGGKLHLRHHHQRRGGAGETRETPSLPAEVVSLTLHHALRNRPLRKVRLFGPRPLVQKLDPPEVLMEDPRPTT